MSAGVIPAPNAQHVEANHNGVPLQSLHCRTTVFVSDAKTKTGTNTSGADSQFNPAGVIDGSVLNHGKIYEVTVPDGATTLDLCCEWTGTTPTTRPKVRVFGRTPGRGDDAVTPWDIDNTFGVAPTNIASDDWRPIASGTSFLVELGNNTNPIAQSSASSIRSELSEFKVKGLRRILVLVDVAAIGPTAAMVVGWFSFNPS